MDVDEDSEDGEPVKKVKLSKEEKKALKKAEKKDEAKIERIKAELEEGTTKKGKSALIVEFSIENVQVVKRRAARQEEQVSVLD